MGDPPGSNQTALYWDSVPGTVSIHPAWLSRTTTFRDAMIFVGIAAAMAAVWLFTRERWWLVASAVLLVIAQVVTVVTLLTRRGSLAAGRAALEEVSADTWDLLATRAWIKTRLRTGWWWLTDPRVGIDENEWFTTTPPSGQSPRPLVIFCRSRIEFVPGGDELQEATEVGAMRRMTAEDRRRRQRQFIWISIAAAAFIVPILTGSASPRFWGAWVVFQLVAVAYRLGWGPFHVNSAIASIANLEVLRWGSRTEFRTDDSVLVVEPAGVASSGLARDSKGGLVKQRHARPMIQVHAVRRDGARATLSFDNDADPGLSDLLGRWLGSVPPAAIQ